MKDIKSYLVKNYDNNNKLPLTSVTLYGDKYTSMIDEPVYPKDLDKLIKRINTEGDVNYKCDMSCKKVEEESGLENDDFKKSAWVAVIDPESNDNDVIIVSIDDVEFIPSDEKIYGKYRNK